MGFRVGNAQTEETPRAGLTRGDGCQGAGTPRPLELCPRLGDPGQRRRAQAGGGLARGWQLIPAGYGGSGASLTTAGE